MTGDVLDEGRLRPEHMMVEKDRYAVDLSLLEQYQSFTKEVLRVALFGIGALAFFFDKIGGATIFSPDSRRHALVLLAGASILFAFSGGFSLAHRFFSATGFGFHIEQLRHAKAGSGRARTKGDIRNRNYDFSTACLIAAAGLCATAVALVAAAVVVAACAFTPT